MFRHPDPEVLVVGAGPVGLVAALFLQQHGVRVEIVDMHQRTTQHSYALAIHPRTLRVLDEAGLSEGLIGAGRKLTKVAYYEGRERRAEIDYSALASKHPYLLVLRQSLLERAAEEALRQTEAQGPLGTPAPVPRRGRRDRPGGGCDARSGRDRLSGRAKRVGGGAKRDDPTGLCHRRRRLRLRLCGGWRASRWTSTARARSFPSTRSRRRGASRRSAGDSRSGPDERLLAARGGAMPLGIPDSATPLDTTASMERLEQLIAARAPWCTARPTQIYWSTLGLFESRA